MRTLGVWPTLVALSLVAASAWAADGQLTGSVGMEYTSGKYGQSTATDILYIPASVGYEADKYRLKLTVPYIRVKGPGTVIPGIGPTRRGTAAAPTTTESGLGDIVASGSYNVYDNGTRGTLIDLTAKVKLGTADETKNLGTGENDYSFQVDAYQLSGNTTWFGTLGYTFLGSPPGVTLDNVAYLSFGGSYRFRPDTSAGASFYLRDKPTPGGSEQQELTGFLTRDLNRDMKVQVYALLGFADGSPDYGMGAVLSRRF